MTDATYLFMSATSGQFCVSSISTDIFSEQTNGSNRLSNCQGSHLPTSLLFLVRLDFSLRFIPNMTTHHKRSISICANKCFAHYFTQLSAALWGIHMCSVKLRGSQKRAHCNSDPYMTHIVLYIIQALIVSQQLTINTNIYTSQRW